MIPPIYRIIGYFAVGPEEDLQDIWDNYFSEDEKREAWGNEVIMWGCILIIGVSLLALLSIVW